MCITMTFWSMMDSMYNSGPTGAEKLLSPSIFTILLSIFKYTNVYPVLQLPTVFIIVTCCTGL
uniref:Uncharacterized protein n=1 Tax=Urocitellus parryii TaxID=9999 RepID=A0A8D2HM24_UROPR